MVSPLFPQKTDFLFSYRPLQTDDLFSYRLFTKPTFRRRLSSDPVFFLNSDTKKFQSSVTLWMVSSGAVAPRLPLVTPLLNYILQTRFALPKQLILCMLRTRCKNMLYVSI